MQIKSCTHNANLTLVFHVQKTRSKIPNRLFSTGSQTQKDFRRTFRHLLKRGRIGLNAVNFLTIRPHRKNRPCKMLPRRIQRCLVLAAIAQSVSLVFKQCTPHAPYASAAMLGGYTAGLNSRHAAYMRSGSLVATRCPIDRPVQEGGWLQQAERCLCSVV